MHKYRVMVVDDDMPSNSKLYERLFQDAADFEVCPARDWNEYNTEKVKEFDAILLDVNLDKWDRTLKEAFEVVGNLCPVVLVSRQWTDPKTHKRIALALADAKKVILAGTLELNSLGNEREWKAHANSMRSQMQLSIARHRQEGALELKDNDPIHILHLSDPQYEDDHVDNLAFMVEGEIKNYVLDELKLHIHFIAVTGDITYSGQPREYVTAENRLEALVKEFIPIRQDWRERLLIVPGNHDVDMRLVATDKIQYTFPDPAKAKLHKIEVDEKLTGTDHRRCGLQAFRDFAWRLSGNPYWRDADELLWINDSFRHVGIRFYMLNSVAEVDCKTPKNYRIPESVLKKVFSKRSKDGLFGVVLAHHGPEVPSGEPQEAINNWAQVTKTIQNSPIRLYIHGHGHSRMADIIDLSMSSKPRQAKNVLTEHEMLRVMAPTTHLDGTRRADQRGFNIIKLKREHGKVVEVCVNSYVLSARIPEESTDSPWIVTVK